jgi:AraC-like DNA-binding protein
MYEVRSACQSLQCRAWQTDRVQLEYALRTLCKAVPQPESIQEALALKDLLKMGAVEAGAAFHRAYHQLPSRRRCVGSPVEAVQHVWADRHDDPRVVLERWTEAFLRLLEDTHPTSSAERAAAILRACFTAPPDLDTLARESGSSRRALTLDFRRRYGVSSGEYLTRVRLRWFIEEVRKPGSNAGRLAEAAGYCSYHNLTDALRLRTGQSPTAIRCLSHNEVRELLDGRLALDARPALTAECRWQP